MADPARPLLVVYVVWHPGFAEGMAIAGLIRKHFLRDLYTNVAGGAGLNVVYRHVPDHGSSVPIPIEFDDSETAAVVVLLDPNFVGDPLWREYLAQLSENADRSGLATRVFPVAIDADSIRKIGIQDQAIRWDQWMLSSNEKVARLIGDLAYQLSRMLRHYLEHLKHPADAEHELGAYLRRVQVFLSHSKHDEDGQRIALLIRQYIQDHISLSSFFDVHDIPAGLRASIVLVQQVRVSAVIAIYTDSYSSREWCRREVIESKRASVPLVVANSITGIDERGFPYLGNVPVVRLDPNSPTRIDVVVRRLLDEVLKDFVWRCRVELVRSLDPSVVFIPRQPELISLTTVPAGGGASLLVYPDPPLSAEEERLFSDIAPSVQLRSMTEWLAGAVR